MYKLLHFILSQKKFDFYINYPDNLLFNHHNHMSVFHKLNKIKKKYQLVKLSISLPVINLPLFPIMV